jgi:PIN domain nuclease of toxin-antitoxin system
MRILLDTHCWLWLQVSPERLTAQVRDLLADPGNELYLSAASAWEIAVKWSLGKLPLPAPPSEYVPSRLDRQGVAGLPVELRHALQVASLPRHHRDPFDRLLIAQAQIENLHLLTADRTFASYERTRLLWT